LEAPSIDQPRGFGPPAACSCQHGCTSFITLETLLPTPGSQTVVQSSESARFGPSTMVYASPSHFGAKSFTTDLSTQTSSAMREPSSPIRPVAMMRVPGGATGIGSGTEERFQDVGRPRARQVELGKVPGAVRDHDLLTDQVTIQVLAHFFGEAGVHVQPQLASAAGQSALQVLSSSGKRAGTVANEIGK